MLPLAARPPHSTCSLRDLFRLRMHSCKLLALKLSGLTSRAVIFSSFSASREGAALHSAENAVGIG